MELLSSYCFEKSTDAWSIKQPNCFEGLGVHTRLGDKIELVFSRPETDDGALQFGFCGGHEYAMVELRFNEMKAELHTRDARVQQPVKSVTFSWTKPSEHVLRIERTEDGGNLVKMSRLAAYLNDDLLFVAEKVDILPEIGVQVEIMGAKLQLLEFRHSGRPSGIPEYFKVGAWQMPNDCNIRNNLDSLFRGLRKAAEAGVRLLVTPETSITGLHPFEPSNCTPALVEEAERELHEFIRRLPGAPYLIAGLPVWKTDPKGKQVRYNVSRLYAPDGAVEKSCSKIHSCETEYAHGYQLNEFEIDGVPISMHICHDGRYPELWTLPVMFGARLILHPVNQGPVYTKMKRTVDEFEGAFKDATFNSNAFYLRASGGGGSCLVGPRKGQGLLATSPECQRDNPDYPWVGSPEEGLIMERIRVHDAFGYYPVRSYRSSEQIAEAYSNLYRAFGGKHV